MRARRAGLLESLRNGGVFRRSRRFSLERRLQQSVGLTTTLPNESAVYDASSVVIMTLPRPTVTSPRDAFWKMRQR
jgi:hypothetical protein